MAVPDGKQTASKTGGAGSAASSLLGILDLSSPLREVYQATLKEGEASLEELAKAMPGKSLEELRINLNLLARLDYLEKYHGNGEIRFRVKGRIRDKSSLPEDIWLQIGGKDEPRK